MRRPEDVKRSLEATVVPEELDLVVRRAIEKTEKAIGRERRRRWLGASAAAFAILAGSVNLSPDFAQSLERIPVVGSVVRVLSFRFDGVESENVHAEIEAPVIKGLEDEKLQQVLNEKYMEESRALYDSFMEEMGPIVEEGGHMGVDSGFVVETDTDRILSIGRYVVNTVGSSSTTFSYDTIDKEEGLLITLPSLFTGDTYVERISTYLKEEMRRRMAADEGQVYWIDQEMVEGFDTIDPQQSFFLTEEGKLVIVFDKYEVAPGYMGVQRFEIPTKVIEDLLVSDRYIK